MGCSATEDMGMGTSPQTPSPSLPSLRVFRSCSQAPRAGEAGPLNPSLENKPLRNRDFFLSPPAPPAPPQAEEEEGTGDR